MFTVSVERHFWASHQLSFSDGLKEPLHWHNWSITAEVSSKELTKAGVVIDFHELKGMLGEIIEKCLNENSEKGNCPCLNDLSAEQLAEYIFEKLKVKLPENVKLEAVTVTEEPGCRAKFSK